MDRRSAVTIAYMLTVSVLLFGCGKYKPPYQRGYDEGYEAGLQAAEGTGSAGTRAGLPGLAVSETEDTGDDETVEAESEETQPEIIAEESPSEEQGASADSDVLGEESEPETTDSNDVITAPGSRVIRADAVNEAVFSAPEVIEGLRTLYTDNAIFGDYVGDSETNLIHKVGGEHFSSLTYDTIVAFDESMTLQDILDEGFFTKCECCDE